MSYKFASTFFALLIPVFFYFMTMPSSLSESEKEELKNSFSFEVRQLPLLNNKEIKFVREVHPNYSHISAWISSVGAAATIADLDADGRSNDLIQVETRTNQVIVSNLTPEHSAYASFELIPHGLDYDYTMAPMGSLVYDFNRDNKNDILVYYWGRSPVIFYQTGTFQFEATELLSPYEVWFSNAALLNDFDGDGNVDILVSNYFPENSKVLDPFATDNDQVMQHSMSRANNGGSTYFLLFDSVTNQRASYHIDHNWQKDIPILYGWTLAVAAADIDGDMLPEIYLANDFGPDQLLHNLSTPGKLSFKSLTGVRQMDDIRSSVLGKDSFKGMGAYFADFNGDGLLDIYVSNIADDFALEESHFLFINNGNFDLMAKGIAPFKNYSEEFGLSRSSWGWDCKLSDFNNDGAMEALQATGFLKGDKKKWAELQELAITNDELLAKPKFWPNFQPGSDLSGDSRLFFFARSKEGKYFDISGLVNLDKPSISRALAVSDIDNDGMLDFVVANQWEDSYLYKNTLRKANSFIGVKLFLSDSVENIVKYNAVLAGNTSLPYGATITFEHNHKKYTHYIDGGNGHSGKNAPDIHFGMNDFSAADSVAAIVKWIDHTGKRNTRNIYLNTGWQTILLPSN